jgi:hypothetical protein
MYDHVPKVQRAKVLLLLYYKVKVTKHKINEKYLYGYKWVQKKSKVYKFSSKFFG